MAIQGQVLEYTHILGNVCDSQFYNYQKTTITTLLYSKVVHDLVASFKWGSSALKKISSTMLPDLMRVEGRDVTEII